LRNRVAEEAKRPHTLFFAFFLSLQGGIQGEACRKKDSARCQHEVGLVTMVPDLFRIRNLRFNPSNQGSQHGLLQFARRERGDEGDGGGPASANPFTSKAAHRSTRPSLQAREKRGHRSACALGPHSSRGQCGHIGHTAGRTAARCAAGSSCPPIGWCGRSRFLQCPRA
jgi:hypothetical protein